MESDSNSTDTDIGFDPGMRDFASAVAVTFFALNIIFIVCAIYKVIVGRRRIMNIQMTPINEERVVVPPNRHKY